jgi:glycosyltransferase involved in cell wall biosynthesis
MRVLHILPNSENNRIENYAAGIILELQKTGIEQCVVMSRRSPHSAVLKSAGIKILPRPFYAPGGLLRRLWLARWIARTRPDLAHCWTRGAAWLIPSGEMPVVGWIAGYDGSRHLTRCTHIVSANRASAWRLAKKSDFDIQARYIPIFSESPETPPLERHRLATPRDAKVILSLAPLHPASRIDLLLAALKSLPDCILWLGGEGPFRAAIEKSALDLGVIDQIRFAAPRTNPFALLRAADLCIMTAPERSFDLLVPKAWAVGTPVIASRRAGFCVSLEDGVTGLLVPTGDAADVALAVRRILKDNTMRSRLIAKGYAAWLGTYTREAVMRQWVEFYRGVGAQGSVVREKTG